MQRVAAAAAAAEAPATARAAAPATARPHTLQAAVRKMRPLLRVQQRSAPAAEAKLSHRWRTSLRSCLDRDVTTLLVAALTALYLIFVLLDVVVDEVLVVEERSCDHRTEHDALRDFLDAKSIIVARTDVAFLTFFALEVAARCFVAGDVVAYFSRPLNALDLAIILLGIATDVLVRAPHA